MKPNKHRPGNLIFLFCSLPALIIVLIFSSQVSGADTPFQFSPYVEKFATGRIDWDKGLIYGVGRSYLNANKKHKHKAMGAAGLRASGNILKIAAGLRLNDQQTLESLGQGSLTIELKAFIHDREVEKHFVDDPKRPYYEVTRVADIKGISGLTSRLINHLKTQPVTGLPAKSDTKSSSLNDETEPWLVLDARNLSRGNQLNPALFPAIVSEDGSLVYELSRVNETALVQRGMTRYVTSEHSGSQLEHGKASLWNILANIDRLLSVYEAQAFDFPWPPSPRKKRRQFIVKNVQQATGLQKTTLLISARDALEIKKEDVSSKILKNCRVIVVMSSSIGGIEGKIPAFFALNL